MRATMPSSQRPSAGTEPMKAGDPANCGPKIRSWPFDLERHHAGRTLP